MKLSIIRFTTIIDLSKIGYHWYTFAITTASLDKETESKIIEFVSRDDNIIRTVRTLADLDIMMYIATDSTISFHNTIKRIKENFGEIIRRYNIYPVFKEHIYVPLPKVIVERYLK